MRKYRLVAKKGEGTFSEVLKAQNVKDGKYYAIKCMKNRFDSIDQVNNLREIQALRRLSPNQHVITLEEVLYDQPTGRLALVFELMDANLYELIRGRRHYLNGQLVRSYMYQLLKALDHMHRKGIFHRDIKPENILIESTNDLGRGLKLADFGSCRGIYSKQPYTEYISTRWYRAPECLLTDGYYGPEMDQWGAGCVFFEITSLYPLFPGTNELDQIGRVHKVLGNPSGEVLGKFKRNGAAHVDFNFATQKGIGVAQLIPHASAECVDLVTKLLRYDWSDRCTARESLRHPYFRDIREVDLRKAQAESGSKLARGQMDGGADDSGTVGNTGRGPQMAHRAPAEAGGGGGVAVGQPGRALPTIGPGGVVNGGGGGIDGAAGHTSGVTIAGNGNGVTGARKHPTIAKTGSLARGLGGSKCNISNGAAHANTHSNNSNNNNNNNNTNANPNVTAQTSTNANGVHDQLMAAAAAAAAASAGMGNSSEESALPPIMGILGSGTKIGVGVGGNGEAQGGGAGNGVAGGGGGGGGGGGSHGGAGAGRHAGHANGQGGSKASSKKKKKNRRYYDGSIRSKYHGMAATGGGGNNGHANGFGGSKGYGASTRSSSFSLMQAAGGGSVVGNSGAGGGGVGYGNTVGGAGSNISVGGMPAQVPERSRVGKNTTRYRQLR